MGASSGSDTGTSTTGPDCDSLLLIINTLELEITDLNAEIISIVGGQPTWLWSSTKHAHYDAKIVVRDNKLDSLDYYEDIYYSLCTDDKDEVFEDDSSSYDEDSDGHLGAERDTPEVEEKNRFTRDDAVEDDTPSSGDDHDTDDMPDMSASESRITDKFCEDILPPPIDAIIDLNSGLTPCDKDMSAGGVKYEPIHSLMGPSGYGIAGTELDGPEGERWGRYYMKLDSDKLMEYLDNLYEGDGLHNTGYTTQEIKTAWYKYVLERIPAGQTIIDDSFIVGYHEEEWSSWGGMTGTSIVPDGADDFGLLMSGRNVEFSNVYNYYAGNFEEYFKSSDVSEKLLPSIYTAALNNLKEYNRRFDPLLAEKLGLEEQSKDRFFVMDPFIRDLDFFGKNSFYTPDGPEKEYSRVNQKNLTFRQRFEEYTRDIQNLSEDQRANIKNKSSNIIFTPGSYDQFKDIESAAFVTHGSTQESSAQFQYYTDIFPMYNAIRFSVDPNKVTSYETTERFIDGVDHTDWFGDTGLILTLITYIKQAATLYETSLEDYPTEILKKMATNETLSEIEISESQPLLELLLKFGLEIKNIKVNDESKLIKTFPLKSILNKLAYIQNRLNVLLADSDGDDEYDEKTELATSDIDEENKHLLIDDSNQLFLGTLAPGDEEALLFEDFNGPYGIYVTKLKIGDILEKATAFAEKDLPTFSEMCARYKNRSNTILYRIAKFKGSIADKGYSGAPYGAPLQNFWLPQPSPESGKDNITFIDTQIKYGETYTYVLYAYELVFGTETEYSYVMPDGNMKELYEMFGLDIPSSLMTPGLSTDPGHPLWEDVSGPHLSEREYNAFASFFTKIRPHYRINEVEVFKKETTMVDKPPLSPDVRINPISKTESKLLFSLNTSFGEEYLKPIYINQGAESEPMAKIKRAYGSGDLVPFKSDDLTYRFEIYRLDSPPVRYSDFYNNLRSSILVVGGTTDFYVDSLRPNKKYYYTFRSIDLHGNSSNPTPIYEIQMVKDSSGGEVVVFPEIQQYKIDSEVPNLTKSFRKLFNLVPQPEQAAITRGDGSTVNYEQLPEHKLFGDDDSKSLFKVRITSKKTGKKIDLNISFEKEEI